MMDEMAPLQKNPSNMWKDIKGVYASEAVVLLMSKEGFSSDEVRKLFQIRGGAKPRLYSLNERFSSDGDRFLGAVLSKIAQRGNPAPCSLKVERHVLQKAQDSGLLVYRESVENGKIRFFCEPLMKDLGLMLKICCLPELLIDDDEVDLLVDRYRSLLDGCGPVKLFFDRLVNALPDKRLALFVVPISFMEKNFSKKILKTENQMDFVIQIPNFQRNSTIKIAIQINKCQLPLGANDGWILKQFGQIKQQYWESEIRKLANQIHYALPESILLAAKQLRELPLKKKRALQDLILLPIAESHLTQTIAGLIHTGKTAEIAIGNHHQELDLNIVVEAVSDTIKVLSMLYDIPCKIRIHLTDDDLGLNIADYFIPSGAAFSYASIVSRIPGLLHDSIQKEAFPRPINKDASNATIRMNLKFILNNVFRLQEFLENQADLIEQILSLQGTIGIVKSGGGKTLAWQMASVLQPGSALVVVPTWYKYMSYEYRLATRGIHRTINIFGQDENLDLKAEHQREPLECAILFLSADSPKNQYLESRSCDIFSNHINILVFEEVHALSEWSHEFQPAYLNLVRQIRDFASKRIEPSLVGLTSINSRPVLLDIINELHLRDLNNIVESTSYDRKNLKYEIYQVNDKNRVQIIISSLRAVLREYSHGLESTSRIPCGIIVSTHEDDADLGLTGLSKSLHQYLNLPIGICSTKPPKNFLCLGGSREEWEKASRKALLQFNRQELPILLCSSEILAELDREDIRFTLNTCVHTTPKEFYRQIGIAGRDGKQSTNVLFFPNSKLQRGEGINCNSEKHCLDRKSLVCDFPGRLIEKKVLSNIILKLLAYASNQGSKQGKVRFEISSTMLPDNLFLDRAELTVTSEGKDQILENVLYRLLLIGAIQSYDKGSKSFRVNAIISKGSPIYLGYKNYLNRYELEGHASAYMPVENSPTYKVAALKCGCKLIDYCYDIIRIRKANDKAEIIEIAEAGHVSLDRFRDDLHKFISQSEIETRFEVSDSETLWKVLDEIKGLEDLLALYLYCRRNLIFMPDDPLLRIVAGFCVLTFPKLGRARDDLMKGFSVLKDSTPLAYRECIARRLISHGESLMPSKRDLILENIWRADSSLEISRLCYEKSGILTDICYSSLFELVGGILKIFKTEAVMR